MEENEFRLSIFTYVQEFTLQLGQNPKAILALFVLHSMYCNSEDYNYLNECYYCSSLIVCLYLLYLYVPKNIEIPSIHKSFYKREHKS